MPRTAPLALALLLLVPAAARAGAQQGAAPRPATRAPAPSATAPRPLGAFLAERIDASALPVTDRVTDTDGTTYLVEFDRLVLSLRPDGRFRASVRFRRTLFSRDARGRERGTPLQTLTVAGPYEVAGSEIRFTPDSTRENRGLRMLAGRVESARRLSLPFSYRNGTVARERTLVLGRRDDIL